MTIMAIGSYAHTVPSMLTAPFDFTREEQLGPVVSAWLLETEYGDTVAEEIDTGVGIADLVAGTRHPIRADREAVTDSLHLRVLEVTQSVTTEEDLRVWAPQGWRSLQRRAVGPLLERGHLSRLTDGDTIRYQALVDVDDPFVKLTAVELKLHDWRRAIAQAGRYRLFAERSFVALPARRVTEAVVTEAARNLVGVLAIDPQHGVTVAREAESETPMQPQRRRVTSEQLLASTTNPSPRRAGAPLL